MIANLDIKLCPFRKQTEVDHSTSTWKDMTINDLWHEEFMECMEEKCMAWHQKSHSCLLMNDPEGRK